MAFDWHRFAHRPGTRVMGILNVTPDSFSDGGKLTSVAAAVETGLSMLAAGADILDVGGESTRPGAAPVSVAEEVDRVLPVIEGLARHTAAISVDTLKPEVARTAITAGAAVWNDVAGLRSPQAVETAARLGCPVILMHMQGEPRTMQHAPTYADVVAEVAEFLLARREAAVAAGLDPALLMADPGIGFGKTLAHNLALLKAIPELERLTGMPVLIGASRKSLIAMIDPAKPPAQARLPGSLALALHAAAHGARVVRVHDVAKTVQALRVAEALSG
jgi:dihydropteroate synthase